VSYGQRVTELSKFTGLPFGICRSELDNAEGNFSLALALLFKYHYTGFGRKLVTQMKIESRGS
jgi:hypothetical protein